MFWSSFSKISLKDQVSLFDSIRCVLRFLQEKSIFSMIGKRQIFFILFILQIRHTDDFDFHPSLLIYALWNW